MRRTTKLLHDCLWVSVTTTTHHPPPPPTTRAGLVVPMCMWVFVFACLQESECIYEGQSTDMLAKAFSNAAKSQSEESGRKKDKNCEVFNSSNSSGGSSDIFSPKALLAKDTAGTLKSLDDWVNAARKRIAAEMDRTGPDAEESGPDGAQQGQQNDVIQGPAA